MDCLRGERNSYFISQNYILLRRCVLLKKVITSSIIFHHIFRCYRTSLIMQVWNLLWNISSFGLKCHLVVAQMDLQFLNRVFTNMLTSNRAICTFVTMQSFLILSHMISRKWHANEPRQANWKITVYTNLYGYLLLLKQIQRSYHSANTSKINLLGQREKVLLLHKSGLGQFGCGKNVQRQVDNSIYLKVVVHLASYFFLYLRT